MKADEIRESDFLAQVLQLAGMLGWEGAHFRPAQTSYGWRTPVQGTLGKGFPDLVLAHAQRRRVMFVELKRDRAKTAPEQDRVLAVLAAAGAEVHVWRPTDWDDIVGALT